MPIVYCSEPFETLTGYTNAEIVGRNCRFLQVPPQLPSRSSSIPQPPREARNINAAQKLELREKIARGEESQVRLLNYKRTGEVFVNLLTTIPISWDEEGDNSRVRKRYIVGFQVDAQRRF